MAGLENFKIQPRKRNNLIDPVEIFDSLTLRGSINDIWASQKEALSDWHKHRKEPDTQIDMTTGGGKTLVGLLAALSLVNETRGKVLYVCPNNQLVEQAAARAAECGIMVSTYYDGEWNDKEIFNEARGPCITNYHALFHPWSKFGKLNIDGVIFDDAHVAGNVIRSQYRLTIPHDHEAFSQICELFEPYFARAGLNHSLNEARSGFWRTLLFVPMFELWPLAKKVTDILINSGVPDNDETKYRWGHLVNRIDRCCLIISGAGIEISPPALPLHNVMYLQPGVRRIYLTATVPSHAEFIRTFGVSEPRRIRPGGKAGDAQRQFLFMQGDEDAQRKVARNLVKHRKACIITPSEPASKPWTDIGEIFNSKGGHAEIERFSKSIKPEKLILVARYDGVDLPGDACRVLILDRVPSGSGLFERFIDEAMAIEPVRRMRTATRVMQSIGRIFRSNTDHGAVIVCGSDLQEWLRDPQNQAYLPPLIQRQINLGVELRRSADKNKVDFADLLDGVLTGSKDWDRSYGDSIEDFDVTKSPKPPTWLAEVAARDQAAYSQVWEGNYTDAASTYGELAAFVKPQDIRLCAWYRHWQGRCLEKIKDPQGAMHAYIEAVNVRSELGRPKISANSGIVSSDVSKPGPQSDRITALFAKKKAKVLQQIGSIQKRLVNGPETKKAEAATQELGELIGLVSTRPDSPGEDKTGPDVLWRYPERKEGVSFDLKTNKQLNSQYTKKDDIGQYQDHVNYLEENYEGEKFKVRILGPRLPVSEECHPPKGLRIMEVEQLHNLSKRVRDFYEILLNSDEDQLAVASERWLRHCGLIWPNVIDALESTLARDMQSFQPAEQA